MIYGKHDNAADLYAECYEHQSYRMGESRRQLARRWLDAISKPGQTLCDVGAGRGELIADAQGLGLRAMGFEIVPALCTGQVFRFNGLPCDFDDADLLWDIVTCLDVLEHLPPNDTEASMRELWRVTGETLFVSVNHVPDTTHGGDVDLHCNLKTRDEWLRIWHDCGLPTPQLIVPNPRETYAIFHRRAPSKPGDFASLWHSAYRAPILVLGDGPSFRTQCNDPRLKRLLTIGCNRTPRRFQSDFVVCMEDARDPVWSDARNHGSVVICQEPAAVAGDLVMTHVKPREWPIMPLDVERGAIGVSPWYACCVALYMGASKIGVLGVDLKEHPMLGRPYEMGLVNDNFAKLADAALLMKCEMRNLSTDSGLTALPTADLEWLRT